MRRDCLPAGDDLLVLRQVYRLHENLARHISGISTPLELSDHGTVGPVWPLDTDICRRLARLRADASPASCTGEWPAPLVDVWRQARVGEPVVAAARLWPAYLDRVRAYLALASRSGCSAAENTLVTAMTTFLTHIHSRL